MLCVCLSACVYSAFILYSEVCSNGWVALAQSIARPVDRGGLPKTMTMLAAHAVLHQTEYSCLLLALACFMSNTTQSAASIHGKNPQVRLFVQLDLARGGC